MSFNPNPSARPRRGEIPSFEALCVSQMKMAKTSCGDEIAAISKCLLTRIKKITSAPSFLINCYKCCCHCTHSAPYPKSCSSWHSIRAKQLDSHRDLNLTVCGEIFGLLYNEVLGAEACMRLLECPNSALAEIREF